MGVFVGGIGVFVGGTSVLVGVLSVSFSTRDVHAENNSSVPVEINNNMIHMRGIF
jgi:hypothetical protein